MPLFHSNPNRRSVEVSPAPPPVHSQRGSIASHYTSTSPVSSSHSSIFSRHHHQSRSPALSPAPSAATAASSRSSGLSLFSRAAYREDPSITEARQRVASAEAAEKDADRALLQARQMVRQAREHVKLVEREAAEQARLAEIKGQQAALISRRAKPLGRHDRAL